MNIILVSRHRKAPVKLDLGSKRTLGVLGGSVVLVLGLSVVAGYALAVRLGNPTDAALNQIRQLHAQVANQEHKLVALRADAQRQVNALAVNLGRLQAQSMRLNALGQRLTQLGGLDDGEFDFDKAPAVGGPEQRLGDAYKLPAKLDADIGRLSARMDSQQEQFRVLQDLLIHHNVALKQRPAGWPVQHAYISSYYGSRIDPFNGHSEFHGGIDFATKRGTPVHAVAEGIVTFTGVRHGYGKVVEIDHGNGYTTRYAHNRKILAHEGQHVRVGQVISKVGSTGRSTGPHLHFEVWHHGRSVNPLAFVRNHRD